MIYNVLYIYNDVSSIKNRLSARVSCIGPRRKRAPARTVLKNRAGAARSQTHARTTSPDVKPAEDKNDKHTCTEKCHLPHGTGKKTAVIMATLHSHWRSPVLASIVSTWPHCSHRNVHNSGNGPAFGETKAIFIGFPSQGQTGANCATT